MSLIDHISIQSTRDHGDVALCNLTSINLVKWFHSSPPEKKRMAKMAVKSLDLAISVGKCPVEEGNVTNEYYRYMGVGVTNYANLLASQKITIDSPEAAEFTDRIMDDLSFDLIEASMELAKELGAFPMFHTTKWAEGLTPVHLSLQKFPQAWNLTEYGKTFLESGRLARWDRLGEEIKKHGIRNAQVLSIAPTANSGKAINATESTEPVMHLVYKEEGVRNLPALAPNIRENHVYYKPAFECDQKALLTNAIVRQKYLDQAQSITLYLKKADSLKELTDLHMYAFDHGIKTLYYVKQQKQIDTGDDCVACAV